MFIIFIIISKTIFIIRYCAPDPLLSLSPFRFSSHHFDIIPAKSPLSTSQSSFVRETQVCPKSTENQSLGRTPPIKIFHMCPCSHSLIHCTIRSILSSMFRTHGSSFHNEAFRTIMAEIAAIINSRPLTADSLHRPDDQLPLCPANLLTMKSKVICAPPDKFEKSDLYSKRYWRRVQHLANEFWQRWQKEYLTNLQRRMTWHSPKNNFKKDDIVLIADNNLPRNQWLKAKVVDERKDDKGVVRSVKLKTARMKLETGKLIERPIDKLVLLYRDEVEDD